MLNGRFRVFCLWLADAVAIALVWTVVVLLYKWLGGASYKVGAYLASWPVIFLFTGMNLFARLYHGRALYPGFPLDPVEEMRRLFIDSVSTHLLVMAILGFGHKQADVSRVVLAICGLLTGFAAVMVREIARALLKKTGLGQIPAYIVGEGAAGEVVRQEMLESSFYGFKIVHTFTRQELHGLLNAAKKDGVRHLFCCYLDERFLHAQFRDLTSWFAFLCYLPTLDAFPVSGSRAVQLGGLGGLEIVDQHRFGILGLEKTILDNLLSAIIFIVASPFFVLVPILIRLTSPGPVFYKAKRLGQGGETIYVWKFRSMYPDADKRLSSLLESDPKLKAEFEKDFKLRDDPRVTPLGKLLRKTSIDELPQLFNVFTGEMALVGPRPIVEKEVAYYGKAYGIFSSVKPGITGLWQASGRSDTDYARRVALDVLYVNNWSPWMDIWIVFKTVLSVLLMRGAR